MASRPTASYWVFVVILIVLHLVLHIALGMSRAPDLMTVAVLLSARRLSGAGAAAVGLAIGILMDALSLTTFGALAVVYTVVGFVGARSRDLFEGDSLLFVGGYLFIGTWLRHALYLLLTRSALGEPWGNLVTLAPINAVYTAVAGMIALTLYRAATGER